MGLNNDGISLNGRLMPVKPLGHQLIARTKEPLCSFTRRPWDLVLLSPFQVQYAYNEAMNIVSRPVGNAI